MKQKFKTKKGRGGQFDPLSLVPSRVKEGSNVAYSPNNAEFVMALDEET